MGIKILIVILTGLLTLSEADAQELPAKDIPVTSVKYGFGRTATAEEIALLDIDIRPDGKGLPAGQGDVVKGKALYIVKCTACHGSDDGSENPVKAIAPVLVSDTVASSRPKTIGNYWPYATTLFDYIRRTMPYSQPGSLTNNEVYSLTAYLLYANKIINAKAVMNARSLPKIVMPAKKLFVRDIRKGGPEVK